MRESLSPQMQWLASVLTEGLFQSNDKDGLVSVDWPEKGGLFVTSGVFASYKEFVPRDNGKAPTPESLGRFLNKVFPKLKKKKAPAFEGSRRRVPHYDLPPLAEACAAFVKVNPSFVFEVIEDAPEIDPARQRPMMRSRPSVNAPGNQCRWNQLTSAEPATAPGDGVETAQAQDESARATGDDGEAGISDRRRSRQDTAKQRPRALRNRGGRSSGRSSIGARQAFRETGELS